MQRLLNKRPDDAPARFDFPLLGTAAVGGVALIGAAILSEAFLILSLGLVVSAWLFPAASWACLAYFALVFGFGGIVDYYPLDLGPANLYAIDLAFVLAACTALHAVKPYLWGRASSETRLPLEIAVIGLATAWIVYGLLMLAYGLLVQGNPADLAFGDYRRYCCYMLPFFFPLFLPMRDDRHVRALKYVVVMGGLIVIGIGLFRLATGTPARVDEDFETGYFGSRLLLMIESMSLVMLLAYLVGVLRTHRRFPILIAATLLALVAVVLLLLSGYRLSMLYAVLAPIGALALLAWARREKPGRAIKAALLAATLAVPPVLLTPVLLPDQFDKAMLDLRMRLRNVDVQGGFRVWAYKQALREFVESPVVGKGFGYYIYVPKRTQAGLLEYQEMNNPHNLFLGVLYQGGVVGFAPFFLLHALVLFYAVRQLRRIPHDHLPVYVALLVGFLCYLGYANVQPFVASQHIVMAAVMGLLIRLTRPVTTLADATQAAQG